MMVLRAAVVSVTELPELETFTASFGEQRDGSGPNLHCQISTNEDDDDGYCIVLDGGIAHYGGVMSWTVTRGRLHVELDPGAANALGIDRVFEVELAATRTSKVKAGLARVLG